MWTAPIGGWPVPVTDDQAKVTFNAAWDSGIRLFDAPLYGSGVSEKRLGKFLRTKKEKNMLFQLK